MFDQAISADSSHSPVTAPRIGVLADLAALGVEVGGVVGRGIASGVTGPGRRPADDADSGRPRTLAALGAEVEYRLGGFDAARCTGAQAVEVVEGTERMIRILQAAQLAAIGRAEETGAWRDTDVRGCTEWVRRTLDRPWSQAHRLVEAARHLREQPHLARLAATGEVTVDRIVIAAETVAERPDAAVAVCTAATRGERSDFNALCRRYRQAGETDEARAARQRRNRRAGASTDADGMFDFRALGPADEGAELQSLYQPWVDQALREAWALGSPVTAAQARWDALLAMARAAAEPGTSARPAALARGRGSRVKVIVRIDLPALLRGVVAAGEICDLAGVGDLDVASVRSLIAEGAFVAAVLTTGTPSATGELSALDATDVAHLGRIPPHSGVRARDPADVLRALVEALAGRLQPVDQLVHDGRHPNAAQRTALELVHPTCSTEGCTQAFGLQADHLHPFTDSRETRLTDLDRKCGVHHAEKTRRENAERAAARRAS